MTDVAVIPPLPNVSPQSSGRCPLAANLDENGTEPAIRSVVAAENALQRTLVPPRWRVLAQGTASDTVRQDREYHAGSVELAVEVL